MTKKILAIDKDNFLVNIFKAKFEELGFDFVEAHDTKEGINNFHEDNTDLLIAEVLLDRMNEMDMLREIKKDYPDLPIIIFSELGQESDIEEAQSIRVSDYFIKSKSTVDQVVERSKKILK